MVGCTELYDGSAWSAGGAMITAVCHNAGTADCSFAGISFGGSTTMGMESPDNLTYPAQLEKLLRKNNYDAEVLNFGFSSKSLNFIRELFFLEAVLEC